MSNTLVQLTSESYHKNVLNEMHRLRLSRQLCDVTIQVDFHGELEEFEAHRTVLAATSKFFKELFLSEDEVTGKSSKVCLQQMEATDFTCFLEFVYTSRVQVEKGRVGNILEIAKLLQCQDLVDTCEQVNELKPADLQGASRIQANNLSQNVENEAGTKEGLLPLKENPLELALSTVATGNEKANTAQKIEKKREQKKDEQMKSRRLSSRLAGRKVFVDIPKKKYVRKLKDQQGMADELSGQPPTVDITDKTGVKKPDDRENRKGDVCANVTGAAEAAEAAEKSDVADNEDEDPVEDDFYDVDFEIGENQNDGDLEDGEKKKRGGLFRCETCQRGFKYEKSYLKHIKKSHGVMPEVIYRCSTCNQTFANRCNLKIHERHVHSDERLYPCDVCNKAFKRKKDVKRHIRQVHEGGGERHYCQICGKALSSKTALMLHERTHTGDRPYECPDCKAKFSQTSALKTHRRTHTGEKPFSCDECGARFTQNHMLAYHKRCHSGEKPFMCENCGKSFASKEYLKHHARIHTGSKPFKCEVCSRAFAQRNSLHQHMKVHTGERPYCCDQCGKQFTQLNALQRHHRIHTGEKPYMCLLCRRTFTDKSTVRRHTMTHDKETPWKNYLVVLEGNVESGHKRRMKQGNMDVSKQQDKVVPISEAIVSQSALSQANVSTEAVTEQALPVSIAADWSSNGQAIAVVSHASLGGFTVVSIENPVAVACPVSVPVSVCTPVSSDITIAAEMSEQTPGSSSIPITAEASSLNMTENISVEAMEISSENVASSSLQDA